MLGHQVILYVSGKKSAQDQILVNLLHAELSMETGFLHFSNGNVFFYIFLMERT